MEETGWIEIRLLDESDISPAMRLKELAGWNQTESDWRRLLRLEPRGCFAAMLDGRLVGTTTTTTYDRELGWIGMVLVDPENRRRGIATRLIKTALEYLVGKVMIVKLDATPEGERVYESFGFEVESLIERWVGIAGATSIHFSDNIEMATELDVETRRELLELDRCSFGADRSRLIEMLIDKPCIEPVLARAADGRLSGYGLARLGSNARYVGPLVTNNPEQAAPVLDRVLAQLRGQQIYVDLNSAFEIGASLLAERGFIKERNLIRMSRGAKSNPTSPGVFAIAGPEVG